MAPPGPTRPETVGVVRSSVPRLPRPAVRASHMPRPHASPSTLTSDVRSTEQRLVFRLSAFCGGAGFAMSAALVRIAACVSPLCAPFKQAGEIPYDRRMGVCYDELLNVQVDCQRSRFFVVRCVVGPSRVLLPSLPHAQVSDVHEFNSQPPHFYQTSAGLNDRPRGYGTAVTFHYLKNDPRPVTPEEHYTCAHEPGCERPTWNDDRRMARDRLSSLASICPPPGQRAVDGTPQPWRVSASQVALGDHSRSLPAQAPPGQPAGSIRA